MNKVFRIFAVFAVLATFAACSDDDKGSSSIVRDTDKVSASCLAQDLNHWVLADGEWTSESEVSWITIVPESGVGNGRDYQPYAIRVTHNHGSEARTGTFYLIHGGIKCPVTVTQGPNTFAYGTPKISGGLTKGEVSTATIQVPYTDASGEETVKFTVTVSGASDGITVAEQTVTLSQGNNSVILPITGTPTSAGSVTFAVAADGTSIGQVAANVAGTNEPSGLPCGWNFYAIGYSGDNASTVKDSPQGQDWIPAPHKVYPTSGDNDDAYFTAVGVGITNWTFNPSIQAQALKLDDYWLAVIPVQNFTGSDKITVEMGCGGAGGSVGFYMLEYSVDNGGTWVPAPDATSHTRGTETFLAHLWNTGSSIGASGYTNTRKTYDKATDDTYRKYTFTVNGLSTGNLYLRLRVLKYRATPDSTADNNGTGWTDIKGFEVSFAE